MIVIASVKLNKRCSYSRNRIMANVASHRLVVEAFDSGFRPQELKRRRSMRLCVQAFHRCAGILGPRIFAFDYMAALAGICREICVDQNVINPMIVDGQIHGGVALGIGNAFYEELVFDEFGGAGNASFMDYLLPTATDVPPIETAHRETPSPLNPLGTKGVGEAGAIPVAAAFAQAVEDALSEERPDLEILDMPMSPGKLFELRAGPPTEAEGRP